MSFIVLSKIHRDKPKINFILFYHVTPSILTLKGTGTRDLIWLKVVSLDRSWLVGLTEDL